MRTRAVALLLVVTLAGCGSAGPGSVAQGSAVPSSSTAVPSGPPSTGPGQAWPPSPTGEEIGQGFSAPSALATATGDQVVRWLVEASGLAGALGPEADAAIAGLLEAEHAAAAAELRRQGIDPGSLAGSIRAPVVGDAPGGVRLAKAGGGAAGLWVFGVVAASSLTEMSAARPDATGRVVIDANVDVTKTDEGLTMTLHETLHGDLERCPDPAGQADGKLELQFDFSASGTANGVAVSFGASGELAVRLGATNSPESNLTGVTSSVSGDLTSRSSGDSTSVNFANFGLSVPHGSDGFQPGAASTTGQVDGEGDEAAQMVKAIVMLAVVLAMLHGNTAEQHWQSGACVSLDVAPPAPRLAGEDRSLDVTVSAISKVDEAAVAGRLTVTPLTGEVSPTEAQTPASLHVTVPDGEKSASADLELRSLRGVAKDNLEVQAREPIEWSGTFTMKATTKVPDVGSSSGTTTFTIRFIADVDAFEPGAGGDRVLVPFVLEEDASMSWRGSATALGTTKPFSGSTSRLLSLDYSDPGWPLSLPDGDFLAGEGYIELPARKLYLFLVGVGDKSGAGTFNLGPITDCAYEHDRTTNRIYLVFPLDDEYQIADGSCSDQIPFGGSKSGIMTRGTRSWHFTAKRVQP